MSGKITIATKGITDKAASEVQVYVDRTMVLSP
jgi:hypothetical protein